MAGNDPNPAAPTVHYRLGSDLAQYIDEGLLARSGRTARTLVKNGPLRITMVSLGAGGALAPHRAEGPIALYVLSGTIRFRVGEDEWRLEVGDLLSLGAGVEHSADSATGGTFLLTVAASSG